MVAGFQLPLHKTGAVKTLYFAQATCPILNCSVNEPRDGRHADSAPRGTWALHGSNSIVNQLLCSRLQIRPLHAFYLILMTIFKISTVMSLSCQRRRS